MARNIELLLQENVENLGIVGDVVKVTRQSLGGMCQGGVVYRHVVAA